MTKRERLREAEETAAKMWEALHTYELVAICSVSPVSFVTDRFWLWVARRFVWAAERNLVRARMADLTASLADI